MIINSLILKCLVKLVTSVKLLKGELFIKFLKKKKKKKKINRFMVKKFETIILKFVNMDPFHIKVS